MRSHVPPSIGSSSSIVHAFAAFDSATHPASRTRSNAGSASVRHSSTVMLVSHRTMVSQSSRGVGENVAVPLWLAPKARGEAEDARRVQEALEVVGLGDRARDGVRSLSGGERQRVAIARAIVNGPTLLLADEPTGNLDRDTGRTIYALFDRLRRETARDAAVVVATHDVELAKAADRVFTVRGGEVVPA